MALAVRSDVLDLASPRARPGVLLLVRAVVAHGGEHLRAGDRLALTLERLGVLVVERLGEVLFDPAARRVGRATDQDEGEADDGEHADNPELPMPDHPHP